MPRHTMLTSVVIRTFNEERYINALLTRIRNQESNLTDVEIVLIDSGSTDDTLEIAESHGCRITHIPKDEFTFGRSLNWGCEFAKGDFFVFISGHCLPVDVHWIDELIKPLASGEAQYTYGRQEGYGPTKFSERCHFAKWFPEEAKDTSGDFFCNNANAAVTREAWQKFRFDETLTGLEDMFFAKSLVAEGGHVAYCPEASVYHIHDESWRQVRIRYEREAVALQKIMPEVHFSVLDVLSFFWAGVLNDCSVARVQGKMLRCLPGILAFRALQYWGTYRGNHEHRKLSSAQKRRYFYPT